MTVPQVRSIGSADRSVRALHDSLRALRDWIAGRPHVDSVELVGVELAVGTNSVPHALGRRLRGWIITERDAAADIYRVPGASPELTLMLESSAAVVVNLVVF